LPASIHGWPPRWLAATALEIYTPYNLTIMATALASFQPLEAYEWANQNLSWALVPLFFLAIAVMWTQAFNPFLYFQF
jgi:hypothetical protein